ncbi:hypothetical protein [Streptomyces virginiae]|uniref:hypothetical protein n=1 Tax=Streptomyces virginiae TaxID=1961 RepID=UPI0036FAF1D3
MTTATNVTRVQDDYAQQIASDLSANQAAQEQARTQLQRLQEELGQLEESEKVLLKMQGALGISAKPASAQAARRGTKRTAVPSARISTGDAKKASKPKATVAAKAPRARKAVSETEAKREASNPSWLELVTAALTGQSEPKSAAEVTGSVIAAHPERKVQAAVIRNTLEQGVARGLLERSKQGRSVYYTPAGPAPADPNTDQPQP